MRSRKEILQFVLVVSVLISPLLSLPFLNQSVNAGAFEYPRICAGVPQVVSLQDSVPTATPPAGEGILLGTETRAPNATVTIQLDTTALSTAGITSVDQLRIVVSRSVGPVGTGVVDPILDTPLPGGGTARGDSLLIAGGTATYVANIDGSLAFILSPSSYTIQLEAFNTTANAWRTAYLSASGAQNSLCQATLTFRADLQTSASGTLTSACELLNPRPENSYTCVRVAFRNSDGSTTRSWITASNSQDLSTNLSNILTSLGGSLTIDAIRNIQQEFNTLMGNNSAIFTGACGIGYRVEPGCSNQTVDVDGTAIDHESFYNSLDAIVGAPVFPPSTNFQAVCRACAPDIGRCGGSSSLNVTLLGRVPDEGANDRLFADVVVAGCLDMYSLNNLTLQSVLNTPSSGWDLLPTVAIDNTSGLFNARYRIYIGPDQARLFVRPEYVELHDSMTSNVLIPAIADSPVSNLPGSDVTEIPRDGNAQGLEACTIVEAGQSAACRNCLRANGTWTALGCIVTTPEGLFASIVRLALGVMGGVALLRMIYLGYIYQVGSDKQIAAARQGVLSTLAGLVILVFSVVLLRIIGVNILDIVPAGFYGA